MPEIEALDCCRESESTISFVLRDCNWMQALEGDIDTSHFGFLHGGHVDPKDVPEDRPFSTPSRTARREYHVRHAVGHELRRLPPRREAGPTGASPISCSRSGRRRRTASSSSHVHARAWVPLDDTHTMFVFIWWKQASRRRSAAARSQGRQADRGTAATTMLPNTTDWFGRWRLARRGERLPASTATRSAATRSTPASTISTCRIRR